MRLSLNFEEISRLEKGKTRCHLYPEVHRDSVVTSGLRMLEICQLSHGDRRQELHRLVDRSWETGGRSFICWQVPRLSFWELG